MQEEEEPEEVFLELHQDGHHVEHDSLNFLSPSTKDVRVFWWADASEKDSMSFYLLC